MKTKKESKTKTPQLEVVNDIFMVEKNSRRLVSLKPDIKEAPENMVIPEGIEIMYLRTNFNVAISSLLSFQIR